MDDRCKVCFFAPCIFFGSPVSQATRAAENGSNRDSSEAALVAWMVASHGFFSCPGGTGPLLRR